MGAKEILRTAQLLGEVRLDALPISPILEKDLPKISEEV